MTSPGVVVAQRAVCLSRDSLAHGVAEQAVGGAVVVVLVENPGERRCLELPPAALPELVRALRLEGQGLGMRGLP